MAPGAALAPFAGVIPSTCAAMVVMRSSGTLSSRAACAVSVPYRSMAAVTPGRSQGTEPDQAVAISDRLGPERTQGIGRRRRSRPDHSRAREASELHGEHADPASRAANEQRVVRAGFDNGERGGGCAPPYSKGGGCAVVDAGGSMVRVAAPRWSLPRLLLRSRRPRGERAAEHSVAGHELGHAVTDLVHDPGIVGAEPARQAQAESSGGLCVEVMNQSSGSFQPR